MQKFKRQMKDSAATLPDVQIDFGAAKTSQVKEPGDYRLRVAGAKVIDRPNTGNILVAFDIIEVESDDRIAMQPLWVYGPKSDAGNLVAENQHMIAQLLTLGKLPTSGNVRTLIPKLNGLEFDGRLTLVEDVRSGKKFNSIAGIYDAA